MEPAKPVLRPLAIVTALLLVGAFVYYRSGGAFLSGSKSNPVFTTIGTSGTPPAAPGPSQPTFMSSSKSTFILIRPNVKPPETPTTDSKTPADTPGDANAPPMIPPAKP